MSFEETGYLAQKDLMAALRDRPYVHLGTYRHLTVGVDKNVYLATKRPDGQYDYRFLGPLPLPAKPYAKKKSA